MENVNGLLNITQVIAWWSWDTNLHSLVRALRLSVLKHSPPEGPWVIHSPNTHTHTLNLNLKCLLLFVCLFCGEILHSLLFSQIYFWNLFYGMLFERRSLMHKQWHTMLKDTESMKLYWFECVLSNNWVGLCFGVFSA